MKINYLLIKAMQMNLIGFIDASVDVEIRVAKEFYKKTEGARLLNSKILMCLS